MAVPQYSSWSDLRPELLGLVLKRVPSLADRVRVRAVCRSWRNNAQLHLLPPPLPWLSLLDGTFLSFPGGEVHRMPVPGDARCHGSFDNWLFLVHSDGGCSLMNPFSKTMLQLPKLATIWPHEMGNPAEQPVFFKFVGPSSLDASPDSLLAAMIVDGSRRSGICICQPPGATDKLRKNNCDHIYDVAFFDVKLYALISGKLIVLEIVQKHRCQPKISSIRCISDNICNLTIADPYDGRYFCPSWEYLVESAGRLLLVVRRVGVLLPLPERDALQHGRTLSFEVFEVDLTSNSCRQWRRLSSLAGQALFIGAYSKSVPAAECGLPPEDCIYFTCDYARTCRGPPPDPLRDSGVFNMRTRMVTPLLPETTVVRRAAQGCPTWFFPSGAV
ncbi:hypothetical protein GQ55_4G338300 [Panicum hallii var. hallii]|uniref:KIB1-4 beta-propeller domain-containing protein n=1 Tax=Panicum hallii var. hallii TaxID=1504633 RepID=A0A2T7E312_9POAL|nr:hypothetical protein GQ55_4G338300 [Panicum hallii var. hallii]